MNHFDKTVSAMQGSVDMKENVYALPLPVGMEAKKPNQKNEIFSGEMYQNRSTTIAPPSSWATFDCKANFSFFILYMKCYDSKSINVNETGRGRDERMRRWSF